MIDNEAFDPFIAIVRRINQLYQASFQNKDVRHRFGRPVLTRLFKGEERLAGVEAAFAKNDLRVLFVCQALPILPELSCTLAGIWRMRFRRFFFGYAVGVVPFAFIVAYAGSVSTLSNPGPAIYTAIGVSVGLLILWTLVQRRSA